ncbi:MAG: PAS domain S-box protein [Candidatus Delongbacteria bacterium]|nr:PAS domain S-box protein [Candidatus Delongbacteria bacterium]
MPLFVRSKGIYVETNKSVSIFLGIGKARLIGTKGESIFSTKEIDKLIDFESKIGITDYNLHRITLVLLSKKSIEVFVYRKSEDSFYEIFEPGYIPQDNFLNVDSSYKSIFMYHPAIKLLINPANGKIVSANIAALKFYGYSEDNLLNMNIDDINTLPKEEVEKEMLNAVLEKRSYFNFTHRIADGSLRYVQVYTGPVYFMGMKVLYSVIYDDTERYLVTKKVEQQSRLNELILQFSKNGIIGLDKDDRILFNNQESVRFMRSPFTNPIGKKFNDVFEILDNLEDKLRKKCIVKMIADSEELQIELEKTQIYNSENQLSSVITLNDVTELMLKNEKLIKLNKIKSDFLSNTTHEFKTPLNSIIGYLQILENQITDNKHKVILDSALNSAFLLKDLIFDLLDTAKFEVSNPNLKIIKFDPVSLMNEIISMFEIQINNKNLRFITESFDLLYFIQSDPFRLKQVIINLISNSIKFTNSGFIRFAMKYEMKKEPVLKVEVADSGRGIPDDLIDKIFEPYVLSAEQNVSGSGLGLYISRKIIEMLGGEIDFTTSNSGTTFFVSIPCKSGEKVENTIINEIDKKTSGDNILTLLNENDKKIVKHYLVELENLLVLYSEEKILDLILKFEKENISEEFEIFLKMLRKFIDEFDLKSLNNSIKMLIGEMNL